MKIDHYFRSLAALALLAGFMFSCCSKEKCSEVKETTYNVPEADKNVFPYHGEDTIKLLYNGIDTVVFMGSGKKVTFRTEQDGVEGCPGDKKNLEGISIDHVSASVSSTLQTFISLVSPNFSSIDVQFNGSNFHYSASQVRVGANTVNVLNRIYSDVCLFYAGNNLDSLWYSKTFGIIKIVTPPTKWEIIN